MKNLVFIIIAFAVITSCSSSKETSSSKLEKKAVDQETVKRAVESRQYIIRIDKIYPMGGGTVDLVPKTNFFIMNGEIASVSLAYLGRTYFSRPITGINFNGQTIKYDMQNDAEKGVYNIQVDIVKGNDKFNFFLTVGTTGYCNISLNNPYIESVSYRGLLVPISQSNKVQTEKQGRM